MESWAADELRYIDLGDKRLNDRLVTIVEHLALRPTASVPEASGGWANTKATYRFWDSQYVTPEAIRAAHQQSTCDRVRGCPVVLVVQDTTNLDFTHHPKTRGLGYLDQAQRQGLKVHSALAVSVHGVPLGLVHQEVWTRDPEMLGQRPHTRLRETKDKESQRWLTALQATEATVPAETEIVSIGDREADIYDLLVAPQRAGSHLLIRAAHNRRVTGEAGYLWAALRAQPPAGALNLTLEAKAGRQARDARLAVRYTTLMVQPPRHHKRRAELRPVGVQAVLVEEVQPPAGEKPVCWLLLTTLPVASLAAAVQVVRWYSYRWLIERYHYALKSGCRVEELQLETAERLQRALATYSIVAWRLLWLTYQARQEPEAPCDTVLQEHEWQALYCVIHKTNVLPEQAPRLREAVRWIAQLGGFLGRKHDGEPGVKTIWRGLRRLSDIVTGWQISNPPPQELDTHLWVRHSAGASRGDLREVGRGSP
jgi:hypothetical protein